MNISLSSMFLLLALAVMMPATALAQGPTINSKAGKFKVTLPSGYSKPQQQTQPVPTALGSIDMKMYTSTNESGGSVAMIAYAVFPAAAVRATSAEALLDATRDGGMQNMGATVEHEEEITLSGYPGRAVTFSGEVQGTRMVGRIDYYLIGNTLYQVLFMDTTGDEQELTSSGVTGYFDSFRFTGKKKR